MKREIKRFLEQLVLDFEHTIKMNKAEYNRLPQLTKQYDEQLARCREALEFLRGDK